MFFDDLPGRLHVDEIVNRLGCSHQWTLNLKEMMKNFKEIPVSLYDNASALLSDPRWMALSDQARVLRENLLEELSAYQESNLAQDDPAHRHSS